MSLVRTAIVAVKLLAPEDSPLWHTCPDGHKWREQPDGTVSPSWGLAGTHFEFPDHDPASCPEPLRDDAGCYECPGCHGRFGGGHGTSGVRCDPWNHQPGCSPPPPACLKRASTTLRWMLVKEIPLGRPSTETRWIRSWVQLDSSGAPDIAHVAEPTLF